MLVLNDQTGAQITLPHSAKRIVSLVPSQTELLFSLGLNAEVLAITKFCVHPEKWFRSKPRIGGTKNLNIEAIKALEPDLIIANKEENQPEQVLELARYFPVYCSDIADLEANHQMIADVGLLTAREKQAALLISQIQNAFESAAFPPPQSLGKAVYLIWRNPWMAVGGDTYIHDMLQRAGFENLTAAERRYPTIAGKLEPDWVLLASEPYPFTDQHLAEVAEHFPGARICLVDGEMFSWYGSRPLLAADYLADGWRKNMKA